jgi:hypothetical protein
MTFFQTLVMLALMAALYAINLDDQFGDIPPLSASVDSPAILSEMR